MDKPLSSDDPMRKQSTKGLGNFGIRRHWAAFFFNQPLAVSDETFPGTAASMSQSAISPGKVNRGIHSELVWTEKEDQMILAEAARAKKEGRKNNNNWKRLSKRFEPKEKPQKCSESMEVCGFCECLFSFVSPVLLLGLIVSESWVFSQKNVSARTEAKKISGCGCQRREHG